MYPFQPELRLTTERLILRHLRADDLDALTQIQQDAETMRYMARGLPLDRLASWSSIASALGNWLLQGHGMLAVEEKATGALIGRIGTLEPAGWPGFEMGWMIRREAWGQGYATEGLKRMMEFVRDDLQRKGFISLIRHGNLRSENVARKLGMHLDGEVELLGSAAQVFRFNF